MMIHTDSLTAPLILGWFSVNCEPCSMTFEEWNELSERFEGQFWGISRSMWDEVKEAYAGQEIDFPTLVPVSDSVFAVYHVNFTPQTMVIFPGGGVAGVWAGPLAGESFREIIDLVQNPH